MKINSSFISDVVVIEPQVFEDDRGFFFESFNHKKFEDFLGKKINFVQDNHSFSKRNVIRGLHYQLDYPQGKLIRVVNGEIYDVAVDLRKASPTYGQWFGEYLSAANKKQLWIPEGFAHGFLSLSNTVDVLYKTNEYWVPKDERCILWNDKDIAIKWPIQSLSEVILSNKDLQGFLFNRAQCFE